MRVNFCLSGIDFAEMEIPGVRAWFLWQETSAGFHTRAVLFAFSSAECEHSNLCRNCRVLHVIIGFLDHSI